MGFGSDSDFTENSASYFGGWVTAKDSTMEVGSRSDFMNNSAWYGGCIPMERCNLTLIAAKETGSILYGGNLNSCKLCLMNLHTLLME